MQLLRCPFQIRGSGEGARAGSLGKKEKVNISSGQLVKLQTLWNQYARRNIDRDSRRERLGWASQLVGRRIESFKDLTKSEAEKCISTLLGVLGLPLNSKGFRSRQAERSRQRGTEGRKFSDSKVKTLATAQDLDRIQDAMTRLGWDQARLDAWLRSPSSPVDSKSNPKIRTQWEANRVWWGMKRLLKRAGKWEERGPQPMVLNCPQCGSQHIDQDEWAMKPHKTHLCASCGFQWSPFGYATVGVAAIAPTPPVSEVVEVGS
jgi:hypothetical protein